MMGSTPKDIKEAVLAGSNFVVADMLEAASALVEASKEDDFKPSVESLSRAFNLAEKAEGVATVDSALFEMSKKKLGRSSRNTCFIRICKSTIETTLCA